MKLIKIPALIAAIGCCLIFNSSCKKNLEEHPYSSLSQATVFANEDGLQKATLGIYQGFTNSSFTTWYRFGLSETGHQYSTQGIFGDAFWGDENKFSGTPTSQVAGECDAIWSQDYVVIARANTVISNANTAVSDTSIANVYIAEARFLRAFAYFDLVRTFGGVPIIDEQITSLSQQNLIFGPRATVQQVYDFIVADMLFASTELPDTWSGVDLGRVSAGTAKAMLGKVYLTMAGKPLSLNAYYQKAVDILNQVVGSANEAEYNFSLLPNFADVFSESNKRNPEIVLSFSFFYSSTNTNACLNPFFLFPRGLTSGDEQTFYGLTYQYYQLFGSTDTRRDFTLVTRYQNVSNIDGAPAGDSIIYNPVALRYIDTATHVIFGGASVNQGIAYAKYDRTPRPAGSPPWGYSTDLIQLRFSDVLLCLAEAMIESGDNSDALPLINRVRVRAGATPYNDLTNMEARVRLERRLELTGEYTTVFDIRRWGTLQSEIEAMVPSQVTGGIVGSYNAKYELYPIPQTEIEANPNLTQNQGY
jgi:hypothetical protein